MCRDRAELEYIAPKLREEYESCRLEIHVQKTRYFCVGADQEATQLGMS